MQILQIAKLPGISPSHSVKEGEESDEEMVPEGDLTREERQEKVTKEEQEEKEEKEEKEDKDEEKDPAKLRERRSSSPINIVVNSILSLLINNINYFCINNAIITFFLLLTLTF